MGKLILILGGARSGKSAFALDLAKKLRKSVIFIATASPIDAEMRERIKKHRNGRPKDWKTVEVTEGLDKAIARERSEVIIVDCLTIYIANLMNCDPDWILTHIEKTIAAMKKSKAEIIVVSNEVGCGVHPETKLGRDYRDLLGKVNQMFAREADKFYMMLAGVPIPVRHSEERQRRRISQCLAGDPSSDVTSDSG